jgi:Lar family restriction alleviation protein
MVAIIIEKHSELEPCPFCKSLDLHIETDSHEGSSFQVICDNPDCEAEGPNGATSAEEAVSRWNSRAVY